MSLPSPLPLPVAMLIAFAVWGVSATILEVVGETAWWEIAWYVVGLPVLGATAFVGTRLGGRRSPALVTGFAMGLSITTSIVVFGSLFDPGQESELGTGFDVALFVFLFLVAGSLLSACAALGQAADARRRRARPR